MYEYNNEADKHNKNYLNKRDTLLQINRDRNVVDMVVFFCFRLFVCNCFCCTSCCSWHMTSTIKLNLYKYYFFFDKKQKYLVFQRYFFFVLYFRLISIKCVYIFWFGFINSDNKSKILPRHLLFFQLAMEVRPFQSFHYQDYSSHHHNCHVLIDLSKYEPYWEAVLNAIVVVDVSIVSASVSSYSRHYVVGCCFY